MARKHKGRAATGIDRPVTRMEMDAKGTGKKLLERKGEMAMSVAAAICLNVACFANATTIPLIIINVTTPTTHIGFQRMARYGGAR